MQVLVEVFGGQEDIRVKEGTSKRTGKDYKMVIQTVYTKLPEERFPIGFNVMHFEEKDVLPPGKYVLDVPALLKVNQYGDIQLSSPRAEHFKSLADLQKKTQAA